MSINMRNLGVYAFKTAVVGMGLAATGLGLKMCVMQGEENLKNRLALPMYQLQEALPADKFEQLSKAVNAASVCDKKTIVDMAKKGVDSCAVKNKGDLLSVCKSVVVETSINFAEKLGGCRR